MIWVNEQILAQVTKEEYWLLTHLLHFVGHNAEAWPSTATLVERTGLSRSTLKRTRKSLEEKGIIEVERRTISDAGRNLSNLYRLNTSLLGVDNRTKKGGSSVDQGGSSVDQDGSSVDPEVLSSEVVTSEVILTGVPTPAHEEINLVEVQDDEAPDLTRQQPDALPEKSSAKKEGSAAAAANVGERRTDAPPTNRARQGMSFEELAATAASRNTVGSPGLRVVRDEEPIEPAAEVAADAITDDQIIDATERFCAQLQSPDSARQLRNAFRCAGLSDDQPVNLYAAVHSLMSKQAVQYRRLPEKPYGKLPGYLKTQALIDRQQAERERLSQERAQNRPGAASTASRRSSKRDADGRVKDCPSKTDYSEPVTAWTA